MIMLDQHIPMVLTLRLWGAMCLVPVNSKMVDSFSSHPYNSFQRDNFKICKSNKQQGAKSSPTSNRRARSRLDDREATTSIAISKCPCYSDNSAFYWTDPSILSPAANLTDHSIGCATADSREIQYFLSNASIEL